MVLEAVTARFGAPPHEIAATVLGVEDRETLHAWPRLTHTPILVLLRGEVTVAAAAYLLPLPAASARAHCWAPLRPVDPPLPRPSFF